MSVRKKKGQKEATAGTVISVRFSKGELGRIKQAAEVSGVPSATFVRKSALQMAVETINGFSDPKQEKALEMLAWKIANRIAGKGDLIEVRSVIADGEVLTDGDVYSRFIEGMGPGEGDKFSDYDELFVRDLDTKDKEQLLMAIQLAAHPFAQFLEAAIKVILSTKEADEHISFRPSITENPK